MIIDTKDYALSLDANDPLSEFRDKFVMKDPNLIYLDGNSLGMLPRTTEGKVASVVNSEWGEGLIRSWNTGWYVRARELSNKLAPLIGAKPHEVLICDSTSVNLFKLAYAALKAQQGRKGIVSDNLNFPSDIYLLQGLVELFGNQHDLRLAQSDDGISVTQNEIEKRLGADTALLTLSHVVFKSAFMYNMKAVTELAHTKGAMVLWDLSHAAGAVPVNLNACNVDLAVGCTYKYLNGGPGAPAFLYVREDLLQKLQSPIWGWFGQNNPFDFKLDYEPAKGIERFLAGTPQMLSLSALEPALDIFTEAGMDTIREKSISLTQYLIIMWQELLEPLGYTLGSPPQAINRGSHISLRHPEAYRICKALIDPDTGSKVVIPDFREPDNIRLGVTPLYTSHEDVYDAVMELKDIVERKLYLSFSTNREAVT